MGCAEQTLKKLVRALLVSRVLYGINYLTSNKAERVSLEVLNREAMCAITGLPKSTKLEELYSIAGVNTLEALATENKLNQILRLQKTTAGRSILKD